MFGPTSELYMIQIMICFQTYFKLSILISPKIPSIKFNAF